MAMNRMAMNRWQDWVDVAVGAWMFGSPWALKYATDSDAAAWNAYAVGTVLVILALYEVLAPKFWEEVLNIAVGLWAIASPWVLGFTSHGLAMWNAIAVGAIVLGFAVWALVQDTDFKNWWRDHHFV